MSATWDMTAFFPGIDSNEYRAYCDQLGAACSELERRAAELGQITEDNCSDWITVLLDAELLDRDTFDLSVYLTLMHSADTGDQEVGREYARIGSFQAGFRKAMLPVASALREASDEQFIALVGDAELGPVRYKIELMRTDGRHTMAPGLEALAADLEEHGLYAWERLYTGTTGRLGFDMVWPDGTTERVPLSRRVGLFGDPSADVRRAAFTGSVRAYEGAAPTLAACLNGVSGSRLTIARYRGRPILDSSLHAAGMSRESLDCLMGVLEDSRGLGQRFLKLKARLLGVERLCFADLYAPVAAEDQGPMELEAARELITRSFSRYMPPLADTVERMFDNRWVDLEPRPGKAPGATGDPAPRVQQPRILMTFTGSIRDVDTLAHEMGHAHHFELTTPLRYWRQTIQWSTIEVASNVGEGLLRDALLEEASGDPQRTIEALALDLDKAVTYTLVSPLLYDFESSLYSERAGGEVSQPRLDELMVDAQRKWFGDAFDSDGLFPLAWAAQPHFFWTLATFYNFPYVVGYLIASVIRDRLREEGEAFAATYRQMMLNMGVMSAEDLVRTFLDGDITRPDFWRQGIERIERELGQLERLVAETEGAQG